MTNFHKKQGKERVASKELRVAGCGLGNDLLFTKQCRLVKDF
jgi:hypothetical protein